MQKQHWIMGKNCVQMVIDHSPERIITLFTSKKERDSLLDLAEKNHVKIKRVKKNQLNDLVQSESHQSYVAQIKSKPQPSLKEFLQEEHQLVLMLDAINDPQNLGTLLRAAECFGVEAVIWSKNRGCSLTPVVTKASVGASEMVSMLVVSNLADTVKRFQKEGFTAITAEISDDAHSIDSFSFPEKTLLIMGSEGKGVQPLISKLADEKVYIPMEGAVDSLNVSQATAVFLSHYKKSR